MNRIVANAFVGTSRSLRSYRIDANRSMALTTLIFFVELVAILIHVEPATHIGITVLGGAHGFIHYVHHVADKVEGTVRETVSLVKHRG